MKGETDVQHTVLTLHANYNTPLNTGCLPLRVNQTQHLPWGNPDDLISQEVEAYASQFKDLSLALFVLIGGPGNLINMAVFYKQGLHDRVNLCLFVLAMSDEVYLIASFFLLSENIYSHIRGQRAKTPVNEFMANNNLVFLLGSMFVSFTLSAIIACERCYCVLRPLKFQTLLRTRTMAVIIAVVCLCTFSLCYVLAYRLRVSCVYDPVTGEVMKVITGDKFYMTHRKIIDYLDSVVLGVGLQGVTIVAATAATITTIVKLRRILTWRCETSSSLSAREVMLIKMLVANSVFFIVCIAPTFFSRIAHFIFPEFRAGGRHHNGFFFTLWVLQVFAFANSSLNFFIYFIMGSRYRETFYALFPVKLCRRKGKL